MTDTTYEHIWAALPFPAFVILADGGIADANGAAEQLLSTSLRQMSEKKLSAFFHENSIVIGTVTQALDDIGSVSQYNVDISVIKKPLMTCNVFVSFLHTEAKRLLLIIQPTGVAQKMSQSLTSLSAARSVTAMAAMLAHEIRNPLAGITGASQLLAMNVRNEDIELADMIGEEAKRIGQLVDRVEHFGDQRPMEAKPVNIHDVLDRVQRAAIAGYASDVDFSVDYDPSLPEASGDADQLLQVFQNLVKNAAEAVDGKRGSIKIRTSYNSGVKLAVQGHKAQNLPLQIEVIDNGCGVPETLMNEIFDPFVSSKANGTGLGLSLVSKLIASHGGLVECSSTKGHSIFCVRLPVWNSTKGAA